ncbi:hypothetical protein K1719_009522 [Acacia pycnantha]|nr:hypothetical protein K1719_009522 [Acacia pycnantha]
MHSYTLKSGLVTHATVGCSLFTVYSKCGCLEESHRVFEEVPNKDNVSWASMIAGFVEHGYAGHAFQLFKEMLSQEISPDYLTLTAILTACSALSFLQESKEIHGYAFRLGMGTDIVIGGALVYAYSKCHRLDQARRVFNMLPQKDAVACSSLVSGYAQNGLIEEALLLFHDMISTDLPVDTFTISSVLKVIALSNRSSVGTQLHAYTEKLGLQSDAYVGSSLVTMYSKCGSLEDCCKAFDHIEKLDLIGWTAIIVSYAQHVLLACSHNGLVEEAFSYLNSMVKDYGIKPGHRHYACIVDLLGRSGRLKEAENFINSMPVKPDALIWGTLLAACKVHGDYELGKLAAEKVMELEQCDAGTYVSFSNICADLGQWDEVLRIRELMKGCGSNKEAGWAYLLFTDFIIFCYEKHSQKLVIMVALLVFIVLMMQGWAYLLFTDFIIFCYEKHSQKLVIMVALLVFIVLMMQGWAYLLFTDFIIFCYGKHSKNLVIMGLVAFSEHGLMIRWWSLGSVWWEKLSRNLVPVQCTKVIFVSPWEGFSPNSSRSSIMANILRADGQSKFKENSKDPGHGDSLKQLLHNLDLSYRLEWVGDRKVRLSRHGHELGTFQL